MIRISKKLALAASLTAVVVGLGTGVAFAASENDTDNISPASTAFTAVNTTNVIFRFIGLQVTITCRNSSISGTTPTSGLGPVNIPNPSFSNCTDSVGGTDTVKTNNTNGSWKLAFIDSANDEGIVIGSTTDEPPGHPGHSGDQLQITIPKAGATITVTALPGCVITVAPGAPVTITGSYDDVNTLSFNGVSTPVAGCGATSMTITGTYKFNTNFQDVS